MGNISKLLKEAFAEKKELEARLVKLTRAIEILGGEIENKVPKAKRRHNAATRAKMKDAWARRKANAKKDEPSMVLSVRKDTSEPTTLSLEERQAAAIAKIKQGVD